MLIKTINSVDITVKKTYFLKKQTNYGIIIDFFINF